MATFTCIRTDHFVLLLMFFSQNFASWSEIRIMPIKTCVTHKSAATFGFRYLCAILCKFEKYLWNGKRYQQLKNGIANYNLPLHGSCGQGMSGKVRENQSTRVQKLTKMQKKILTVVCRLHTMVECLFARFTRR